MLAHYARPMWVSSLLLVLEYLLIPWEDVRFYRYSRAATFIRATFHRYSRFEHVCHPGDVYSGMVSSQMFFRLPSSGLLLGRHGKKREALLDAICPG